LQAFLGFPRFCWSSWQTRFRPTPLSPETKFSLSEKAANRQQNNEAD